MEDFDEKINFIWSMADLLRGDYKQSEYGRVILPLVVLRRLDSVLASTKETVRNKAASLEGKVENMEPVLKQVARAEFYNTSVLDFESLLNDPENIATNLKSYIEGFSPGAQEVLNKFKFGDHIARLDKAELLYLLVGRCTEIDLSPTAVSSLEMGYIYEELIRKFSEQSNETAGEHFTPREVIRLMVNLLFSEDDAVLSQAHTVRTLYDPACGTGGMLSVAEDYLRQLNPSARLEVFGQELNDETYAICRSDMMLKGQEGSRIKPGNSFTDDGYAGDQFDYMLANPPYGVDWKKVEREVRKEHDELSFGGRFGAGLPRIDDGSFLFLQHMLSKSKDPLAGNGSRIGIVLNASSLWTGEAGSGESKIRDWIISNDWLELIVALPDDLFYNTGIPTYVWILSNRKSPQRAGKVQLIDARAMSQRRRKGLGSKRNDLTDDAILTITRLYADQVVSDVSKVLPNDAFAYKRLTIERPRRVKYVIDTRAVRRFLASKGAKSLMLPPKSSSAPAEDLRRGEALYARLGDVLRQAEGFESHSKKEALAILSGAAGGITLPRPVVTAFIRAISTRDPSAEPLVEKGKLVPDPDLRQYENVPIDVMPQDYLDEFVLAHTPEAWIDTEKTKFGYEIPFKRMFFSYERPGDLSSIEQGIDEAMVRLQTLLAGE